MNSAASSSSYQGSTTWRDWKKLWSLRNTSSCLPTLSIPSTRSPMHTAASRALSFRLNLYHLCYPGQSERVLQEGQRPLGRAKPTCPVPEPRSGEQVGGEASHIAINQMILFLRHYTSFTTSISSPALQRFTQGT